MSNPPQNGRRPTAIKLTDGDADASTKRQAARTPQTAPKPKKRKPVSIEPSTRLVEESRDPFTADAITLTAELDELTPPVAEPKQRRFSFGKLALAAFGLLFSAAFGLWLDQLIRDLFARADWLGYAALGLLAIGLTAVLVLIAREMIGLAQLAAVQKMRAEVTAAANERSGKKARLVVDQLSAKLASHPQTARGRRNLAETKSDIIDGPDLIAFAETELMPPLDQEARRLIMSSAKRVSIVTAVSPRALVDIGYILYEAARLIRALATLYGGRPGTLGFIRLFRDVIAHLAVTGTIAVGESLIQQLVGQGLASKLSARLGEGVINGLMTARIGISAMDLCRPMPFAAVPRPGIGDFLSDLTISTSANEPDKSAQN